MPTVQIGDVLASRMQTLTNTANCVGVMGKGIAKDFKKRFPEMYRDYVGRCTRHEVRLGEPYLFPALSGPWVLNFPTKDHWRSVSREADIIAGLDYLLHHYREWEIISLAVPPLGCGNGGLSWSRMGPVLYQSLGRLDIPVELYAPYGTPLEQLAPTFLSRGIQAQPDTKGQRVGSHIEPAWLALVEVLARLREHPHHRPIGRTSFQKLAYFATVAGIPTGLTHRRGSYGPFASDLQGIISRLVNSNLLQERQLGPMLEAQPGPAYDSSFRAAVQASLAAWEGPIDRVTDLFLRLPTTRDAEIAATVSFAANELSAASGGQPTELDVLHAVQGWKGERLPELEVARATRDLALLRWLKVRFSAALPLPALYRMDDEPAAALLQ